MQDGRAAVGIHRLEQAHRVRDGVHGKYHVLPGYAQLRRELLYRWLPLGLGHQLLPGLHHLVRRVPQAPADPDGAVDIALKDALARLGEREKHILALRFYEGKTQMEVSAEVGISQAQVSRLEKNALKAIQKNI